MHLTRNEVPRTWPIPRKGTKSIIVPKNNKANGIPLLILLRDMLKIGEKRKEIEKIMREGKIKVNGKVVKDEKYALVVLDILSLGDKSYKLTLEKKRFNLKETKDREKIVKIAGRKILNGKKVQINLSDGRNIMTADKLNIGDSVAINFEGKIARKIELRESSRVMVISGSHIGEEGKVERIDEKSKTADIIMGKEKVNLNLSRIMAI